MVLQLWNRLYQFAGTPCMTTNKLYSLQKVMMFHVSKKHYSTHATTKLFPLTGLYTTEKKQFKTSSYCYAFEDKETKALSVWSNLKELKASPLPALTLGFSGLFPFLAGPAYMISSNLYMTDIAFAQVAYGACILSFLGGIRWGFTIPEENPVHPDWVNLGYSVLPSLMGWTGLLLPMPFSVFTVMGGLVFSAYCDMAMYGYPPWFKGLRFVLSFVAVLSLWTTFMCSFMLKCEESKSS